MDRFQGLSRGSYRAILADPPWRFATWSAKGGDRSPDYPTMAIEEIGRLPVAGLAAEDCVLFLWGINPMLQQAMWLMNEWGFAYKTVAFVWVKSRGDPSWAPKYHMGLGYWTRANTECCLLGTRGKPRRLSKGVRQLLVEPLREHSRKPDTIYERIESLVEGPYLELFARQRWPGWDAWGAEVDRFREPVHAEA